MNSSFKRQVSDFVVTTAPELLIMRRNSSVLKTSENDKTTPKTLEELINTGDYKVKLQEAHNQPEEPTHRAILGRLV